jgi:3-hydroxyacyl-CoA dehydrogenase/enoyl-CoA hydratase/3-hydroxybutyryl-CoA epimerase/enoyl-CoA isomerase
MIYQGNAIKVTRLDGGIARLAMDLPNTGANVFNELLLQELQAAVNEVAASDVAALLIVSEKPHFLLGADIGSFTETFALSEPALLQWLQGCNAIFNQIEDLPIPTVAAINGMALGGGLELCLACDFRVAATNAMMGFPEVNLGICPGFGGTVRAPRLMGVATAIEWVSSGKPVPAQQALAEGILDGIADPEFLESSALEMIEQALRGDLDMQMSLQQKTSPVEGDREAVNELYRDAIAALEKKNGAHYPAAVIALSAMWEANCLDREGALECEHQAFAQLARSETSANLIQLFHTDQYLKSKSRDLARSVRSPAKAAVLGAGIMGGGIAYQSALKNIPIIMKDIAQEGLDLGLAEAGKLLGKQVDKGRLSDEQSERALANIQPELTYNGFDQVDIVVEAVVENPKVKKIVLAEVEQQTSDTAILTSNTSTISITDLATALSAPERFCGMHFFNPVPIMPLVEVIRGEKSSDDTIAKTVAYATALGKTPIVVNDCPGFLVNRILFPYFGAYCQLIRDGVDFWEIDRVMEAFGWPMGPAYLLDVVGIDTAEHCMDVMADGFPDRMKYDFRTVINFLYEQGDLGQKTGQGFYRYEAGKGGRPQKTFDESIANSLSQLQQGSGTISDRAIEERMMVALCLESVRGLEDGIVETAIEADMGLILGLGFPRFRGGALRYIDNMGVANFITMAERYADLGPLYHPTEGLKQMASEGRRFYS